MTPGELRQLRFSSRCRSSTKADVISDKIEKPVFKHAGSWVFTDLDGTLLDHHDYSWHAAEAALSLLKESGIPVIINTSKTRAEVAELQAKLAPGMPYIIENGAAAIVPNDCCLIADSTELKPDFASRVKVFGIPRETILRTLEPMKTRFDFTGFSELSVDELVDVTQLQPAQAAMALQREYSEPLIWRDGEEQLQELTRQLAEQGLSVTQGGRFAHIAGPADKGAAMRWLVKAAVKIPKLVIALGDSDNDRPMLEQADWPVVVRTPAHTPLIIDHPNCLTTELTGPAGWNAAIHSLLQSH